MYIYIYIYTCIHMANTKHLTPPTLHLTPVQVEGLLAHLGLAAEPAGIIIVGPPPNPPTPNGIWGARCLWR